jgi:holo-[acyl-carrier protein] synthase
MTISGIGIDVIEIRRFRSAFRKKHDRFFESTFSHVEREYCLSYRDSATHFAGTFAAKEAVQKALGTPHSPQQIEIRRQKNGEPEVWLKGRRSKSFLVSISHNESIACAIALHRS